MSSTNKNIETYFDNGKIIIPPSDSFNQTLVNNVHPAGWTNPEPKDRYNLVVIGAGTGGLVTAIGAATLGARVAIIEKHLMGGDCLNVGCVPSKGLIRASRAYAEVRDAGDFGVEVPAGSKVNFQKVMERMRRIRSQISQADSAQRYKKLGVDVFIGSGKFLDSETVEVDGKQLKFSKCILATGARAVAPEIPGLAEAGYLNNENLFNLTELPKRLGVIGAGPIGCEMAQSFARFGSQVTLFEMTGKILPREDTDAAAIVQKSFKKDRINLVFNCALKKIEKRGNEKVIYLECGDQKSVVIVDEILAGVGRAPNVEGLNLERVNVHYDKRKGVSVNDNLRTTNPKIYAVGDICSPYKFTHTAEAMAVIAIQNALFKGRKKTSSLVIPWCTYTDPEIAHVGLYEKEAEQKGIPVETFVRHFKDVDRAQLDGEEEGFVKIHSRKGTDQILGATIVAKHAGEMISELTLAMTGKVGLKTLSSVITPYPVQADAIKRAAGAYLKTKLTPTVKNWMGKWFSWTR